MVASVGSSYNVLTLFQTGTGSPSTAKPEAVDAIIEKVRQLKADASPAYVQASSFATDAWISGSEEADSATAAAATVTRADSAKATGDSDVVMSEVGTMFHAFVEVENYNSYLSRKSASEAGFAALQEEISSASDPSQLQKLNRQMEFYKQIQENDNKKYPSIEKQLLNFNSYVASGYDVSGSIVEKQADGSFKFGVFNVSNNGQTYFEHDGSGIVRGYNNSGQLAETFDLENGGSTEYAWW